MLKMALPKTCLLSRSRRKIPRFAAQSFFIVCHSKLDTMPSHRKKSKDLYQAERGRPPDQGKPIPWYHELRLR